MNDPIKLSKDEIEVLNALVQGPAFRVLEKVMQHEIEMCNGRLATAENTTEIYRLQGRVAGVRALIQIPKIISHNRNLAKAKDQK